MYENPPAKVNFTWHFDQLNRTKKFSNFLWEVDITILQIIPHPDLFYVSRYEKRDTEKRASEIGNCPQYCTVQCKQTNHYLSTATFLNLCLTNLCESHLFVLLIFSAGSWITKNALQTKYEKSMKQSNLLLNVMQWKY